VKVDRFRNYDVLQDGAWLVIVRPGSTTIRPVEPAYVEVEAALHEVEDAMVTAMVDAAQLAPRSRDQTPKEKRAYDAYCNVMGGEVALQLEGKSFWDIAQAGLNRVREIIKLDRRIKGGAE